MYCVCVHACTLDTSYGVTPLITSNITQKMNFETFENYTKNVPQRHMGDLLGSVRACVCVCSSTSILGNYNIKYKIYYIVEHKLHQKRYKINCLRQQSSTLFGTDMSLL